jgi:hypothetical protein
VKELCLMETTQKVISEAYYDEAESVKIVIPLNKFE